MSTNGENLSSTENNNGKKIEAGPISLTYVVTWVRRKIEFSSAANKLMNAI